MAALKGEIYFLHNIPLLSSYEHTIDFKDRNEQLNYFLSKAKYTFTSWTYIRKEREYIIPELPMNALDDVNYIVFRASENDRYYFAFVTDRRYVSEVSTEVYYTIDVLQTYMFDYKFRPSYIKQAHVDRWTAERKPIYSLTDEGLNYGSEYVVENAYRLSQDSNLRWLLVTMKGTNDSTIVAEGSALESTPFHPVESPYAFFLMPLIIDENNTGVSARNVYIINNDIGMIGGYNVFSELMSKSAIGDYVVAISLLSYNPFVVSTTAAGEVNGSSEPINVLLIDGFNWRATKFTGSAETFLKIGGNDLPELLRGERILAEAEWKLGLEEALPTAEQWDEVKTKPRTTPRDKRFESKLLCAPYRYNILTDWRNQPAIFKNEYMTTDKLEVMFSFAPVANAPFRFWIKDYRRDPQGRYTSLIASISPEMPIISDAYYQYMLQNKNTIQNNVTNALIGAATGTVQGAISGAAVGGVWGAIGGAVLGAGSGALNVAQVIRNENAKQADLKTLPDIIVNSTDSSFNVNDMNDEVTFYRMKICCQNEEILADIFNMTGYTINRVEIPNLRSRVRFNYIQTMGANIDAKFNQADVLKIKEIYDRGVTIWHYSEQDFNFLDYSHENMESILI